MRSALLVSMALLSATAAHAESCIEVVKKLGLPYDAEKNTLIYQSVVELPAVSKDMLYSRAKAAIVTLYKSGKDVIQLEDADAGRIVGKGNAKIYWDPMGLNEPFTMWHTLTIEVKDAKYRITISEFVRSETPIEGYYLSGKTVPYCKAVFKDLHPKMLALMESVKFEMAKTSPVGDDEW